MAELRRLLIEPNRLKKSFDNNELVELRNDENHYLSRVLRLKAGDEINVVDGCGNMWLAKFMKNDHIKLNSKLEQPFRFQPKLTPKICIAIVLPRRGFEEALKMCCELGIDVLQPITSNRCVFQTIQLARYKRWNQILNESVEQTERFWRPELRNLCSFSDWLNTIPPLSLLTIGTTRLAESISLDGLLNRTLSTFNELWVVIGPEGGWTNDEIEMATTKDCIRIKLGDNILRTSTAAIAATQIMNSWRSKLI